MIILSAERFISKPDLIMSLSCKTQHKTIFLIPIVCRAQFLACPLSWSVSCCLPRQLIPVFLSPALNTPCVSSYINVVNALLSSQRHPFFFLENLVQGLLLWGWLLQIPQAKFSCFILCYPDLCWFQSQEFSTLVCNQWLTPQMV